QEEYIEVNKNNLEASFWELLPVFNNQIIEGSTNTKEHNDLKVIESSQPNSPISLHDQSGTGRELQEK
ncbi:hypothetical protein LINGRAHAP2_LOCUS13555, partial [Linum grandiflorum]